MKDQNTLLLVIGAIALIMFMNKPAATTVVTNGGGAGGSSVDLCSLVDGSASFTGQRMFLAGTTLTNEYVRILKPNGDTPTDLGQVSMNSGTKSISPKATYNLYYGENSTGYYMHKEVYTAPCDKSPQAKKGILCQNGTLTITSFDEYGNVMGGLGSNEQAVSADDEKEITVRFKIESDRCYGNPDAATDNVVCFRYSTTYFKGIESTQTTTAPLPYTISNSYTVSGFNFQCFKLPKLKDMEYKDIVFKLKSTSTDPIPTAANTSNIQVLTDDIDFDLDADTLQEIWDFQDEDQNALGAPIQNQSIYIK